MKAGADNWIYKDTYRKDKKGRRKHKKMIARHRKERITQGWSVFDWWSGDAFILGVIAGMADKFRTEGGAYPGEMTAEEWAVILDNIAAPLNKYLNSELIYSKEDYEAAGKALHLFADNFGSFWD